ncbi:MAG TPA: LamG-like jellyroll fold domain-containing protein [Kofleriaceae bacterium]|nr:LamG-like jellyroll fold domain-containing protein [Kofleriaceae bacterium]
MSTWDSRDRMAVALGAIVVGALAGCTFSPRAAERDASTGDPDRDAAADSADVDAIASVPCGAPDPGGLLLCLELDDGVDDGLLVDSAPGHHHALTSGLSPMTRTVPWSSAAARVGATSETRVAEDPILDRDAGYSYGMWVSPTTVPAPGAAVGVIDHELQYALVVGSSAVDGSIQNRCVHTGVAQVVATRGLAVATWSFLACTWDGTTLCAIRWTSASDHERTCEVASLPPSTTGAQGLAIGHLSEAGVAHSRFDGAIDSVQLYRAALTADQICTWIGQPAGCLL